MVCGWVEGGLGLELWAEIGMVRFSSQHGASSFNALEVRKLKPKLVFANELALARRNIHSVVWLGSAPARVATLVSYD